MCILCAPSDIPGGPQAFGPKSGQDAFSCAINIHSVPLNSRYGFNIYTKLEEYGGYWIKRQNFISTIPCISLTSETIFNTIPNCELDLISLDILGESLFPPVEGIMVIE